MARMNIRVEGLQQAMQKLEAMGDVTAKGKLTEALVSGAQAIAETVETRTPRGPTGNLKRAVKAFAARFRPGKAMAAFTLIKRQIAQHLHLVSFGRKGFGAGQNTGGRSERKTGKKALFGLAMSGFPAHPVKRVKAQPPNPFFKEGVAAARTKAKRDVEQAIKEIIERAAR
jgi:hypothetical protein